MARPLVRLGVLAAAAAGAVGLLAAPASAHVTAHPDGTAVQGGYAKVTIRVPNESDGASTTKVQVSLPEDAPIASVSVMPRPGWSYKIKKAKPSKPLSSEDGQVSEVVSRITWTADSAGTAIKPGEFDEFAVSLGPLPKVDQLVLPTLQTYSDGEVSKWIETAAEGGPEPEHPAPTVQLTSENAANADTVAAQAPAAAPASDSAATASDQGSGGGLDRTLAIVALVVALLAAAVAGMNMLRARAR